MSTDATTSSDLSAAVAAEIRACMGRLNISRSELARRLEVDDTWVGKRLNGRTEIGLSDLQRIAAVLHVKSADLVRNAETGGQGSYVSVGSSRPVVTSVPLLPLPRGPLAVSHPGRGWVPPEERRTAPIAPRQRVGV